MISSRNDKIDFLLEYASSKVPCNFAAAISKLIKQFGEPKDKEYERLIVELISLKILRSVDEQSWSNFLVDELGFHILNNFDSYSSYKEYMQTKEQKELELLHNNATIAKQTRRFMYISLLIGFIGGISGVLNITSKLISTNETNRPGQINQVPLDTPRLFTVPVDTIKNSRLIQ